MTFSLVARCAETGMFGMVISSSSPAVAARCSHARAGVGVVASQNVTDPSLGPLALDAMAEGLTAAEALARITTDRPFIDYRQLLVVDQAGGVAIHSGKQVLGIWAEAKGADCAAGGNLLDSVEVPEAMVATFCAAKGHLADRLMLALQAGRDAGGEAGPEHSAGIKVVDRQSWPIVDLRVDWSDGDPVDALFQLWSIYKPQMAAYIQRAEDPRAAPSYGVPGDE